MLLRHFLKIFFYLENSHDRFLFSTTVCCCIWKFTIQYLNYEKQLFYKTKWWILPVMNGKEISENKNMIFCQKLKSIHLRIQKVTLIKPPNLIPTNKSMEPVRFPLFIVVFKFNKTCFSPYVLYLVVVAMLVSKKKTCSNFESRYPKDDWNKFWFLMWSVASEGFFFCKS